MKNRILKSLLVSSLAFGAFVTDGNAVSFHRKSAQPALGSATIPPRSSSNTAQQSDLNKSATEALLGQEAPTDLLRSTTKSEKLLVPPTTNKADPVSPMEKTPKTNSELLKMFNRTRADYSILKKEFDTFKKALEVSKEEKEALATVKDVDVDAYIDAVKKLDKTEAEKALNTAGELGTGEVESSFVDAIASLSVALLKVSDPTVADADIDITKADAFKILATDIKAKDNAAKTAFIKVCKELGIVPSVAPAAVEDRLAEVVKDVCRLDKKMTPAEQYKDALGRLATPLWEVIAADALKDLDLNFKGLQITETVGGEESALKALDLANLIKAIPFFTNPAAIIDAIEKGKDDIAKVFIDCSAGGKSCNDLVDSAFAIYDSTGAKIILPTER